MSPCQYIIWKESNDLGWWATPLKSERSQQYHEGLLHETMKVSTSPHMQVFPMLEGLKSCHVNIRNQQGSREETLGQCVVSSFNTNNMWLLTIYMWLFMKRLSTPSWCTDVQKLYFLGYKLEKPKERLRHNVWTVLGLIYLSRVNNFEIILKMNELVEFTF